MCARCFAGLLNSKFEYKYYWGADGPTAFEMPISCPLCDRQWKNMEPANEREWAVTKIIAKKPWSSNCLDCGLPLTRMSRGDIVRHQCMTCPGKEIKCPNCQTMISTAPYSIGDTKAHTLSKAVVLHQQEECPRCLCPHCWKRGTHDEIAECKIEHQALRAAIALCASGNNLDVTHHEVVAAMDILQRHLGERVWEEEDRDIIRLHPNII